MSEQAVATGDDDSASGKLPGDKLSKIAGGESLSAAEKVARGVQEFTTERLAHEHLESPSIKMAREIYHSPAAQLARDHANSPAQQLAKLAALGLSPTFGTAEIARIEAVRKMLEPATALTARQVTLTEGHLT